MKSPFFWFCWLQLLFLTVLDGQEEPWGKVIRAAETGFLAQEPHSLGSFLFAKGELWAGSVGVGGGGLAPQLWSGFATLKEDKEDISGSAQAQPSCQLLFLLGWGAGGGGAGGTEEGGGTEAGERKLCRNRMYLKFSLCVVHPRTGLRMGVGGPQLLHIYSIWLMCGAQP